MVKKPELAQAILGGDVGAAARLITRVESDDPAALPDLKLLYRHGGRAHVIGLTGPPGTGKSTLADRLTSLYRSRGKRVGILAVDPSSPFTGGAILGDRLRMSSHAADRGVFIRSMATRGQLGGVARATADAVNIMDALGQEVILVETVGVGQGEVEVVRLAQSAVLVLNPGSGDAIQTLKAGIMEIGHIFVVNKARREGADRTCREIEEMLGLSPRAPDEWRPPVLKTEALEDEGIDDLASALEAHRLFLHASGQGENLRQEQARGALMEILRERALERLIRGIDEGGKLEEVVSAIARRELDPYSVAEELLERSDDGRAPAD
ncbi:MAG: methylmalonyl Co-A mutase-associated GTPase MeaB [Nitrospinota bacterium]